MATPSGTNSAAFDSTSAPSAAAMRTAVLWVGAGLVILAISCHFAEVRPAVLFRPATAAAVWSFLAGLFPPDVKAPFLRTVLSAVVETIATALSATVLSIALALPLSFLATGTLWNHGILFAWDDGGLVSRAGGLASRLSRGLLGFMRAVPDLVWALLFVAAVGLGPLAGMLALTVAYTGVLGRVYADVFEHVNPQPLEALESTGATRLQIFLRGVWPQALPHIVAYSLYSFECCLRAAAVLGFVGAGGIGYEISISMRLFEYKQVLTLLVAFIALLAITDAISRYVRARVVNGAKGILELRTGGKIAVSTTLQRRTVISVLILLMMVVSFPVAGFTPEALVASGAAGRMANFVRHMLPPDLNWAFISNLGIAVVETISISFVGTLSGVALGVVLAVPATSTLVFVPKDFLGTVGILDRALRWLLFWSARLVLNVLRSIPELVWVLVCILAVGIGPFAGTIALALHTAGVLGKIYAETMEEVPVQPVEALRSLGARPLQILAWAIWPQARPLLASYTVLRWEMNLRAATILGLVGGGGLGQAIYNNVQLGFYNRVSALILLIYALVLASDWAGERLRWRIA